MNKIFIKSRNSVEKSKKHMVNFLRALKNIKPKLTINYKIKENK